MQYNHTTTGTTGTLAQQDFSAVPNNFSGIELEQEVLGKILLDPVLVVEAKDLPLPAFSISAHRQIFKAILDIHKAGQQPDLLTVRNVLETSGILQQIGGQAKLAQLLGTVVHSGELKQYVELLRQNFHRQYAISKYRESAERLEAGEDLDSILEQNKKALASITVKAKDPDERLKLELQALLAETDLIKKSRLKAELSSHYRLSKLDIDQLLQHMRAQNTTACVTHYTLGEFLAQSETPLQYLVPGMIPKGECVVLAAPPKCGKTLLAIDLAFAVATGSEYLGEVVPQGKVLLISVDESEQSLRHKLDRRGFTPEEHNEQVEVMTRWNINQLEELEEKLERFRPDLVIVDSLKRITHGSPISENSAEFSDNLYTLKETFARYGAASVLIHHTNKDKDAQGVYQVRGSSAIAGAVWGVLQLRHILKPDPQNKKKLIVDPKESKRILDIYPRDAAGQTLTIDCDPEDHSWLKLSALGEPPEAQTMRQRIHSLLEQNSHREGLTASEIKQLLGLEPDDRFVWNALNRMVDRRELEYIKLPSDRRIKVFRIVNPQGDTPPSHTYTPVVTNTLEPLQGEDYKKSPESHHHPQISHHPPSGDYQVVTNLNPCPEPISGDSHHPSENRGGEGVSPENVNDCKEVQNETSSPASTEAPAQQSLKVGDRVRVNLPGSNRHGKTATIKRFSRQGKLEVANLLVDGEGFGYFEAQLAWLKLLSQCFNP